MFVHSTQQKAIRLRRIELPIPGLQMERWTVDTPDDLQFVSEVARRLDSNETPPSHLEILEVLEAAPDLREINAANKRNAGYDKSLEVEGARETTTFDESERALTRALRTVPLGAQTFSRSHIQFPRGRAPLFLTWWAGRVTSMETSLSTLFAASCQLCWAIATRTLTTRFGDN